MQPHYSQSSRENATPSSGTSPLAYYKEVQPRVVDKGIYGAMYGYVEIWVTEKM